MKNIIAIIILVPSTYMAQIYERTGKNLGVYFGGNASFISSNLNKTPYVTYSASGGLIHMVSPGIYPKLGYHYGKMPSKAGNDRMELMSDLHSIDGSLLIDKSLIKLSKGVRVMGGCHYLSIGLIIAPEYRYTFSSSQFRNDSFGEISLLSGLSFTHMYKRMSKRNKSRTTQYDVFFRQGFTPFYTTEFGGEPVTFKRFEVGLSIRKIKHQVFNFLI